MIVPKSVINKIHRVEFSLYEPNTTTVLWAYPVGQSYDYRLFLSGQWTSVSDDGDASLLELIQRAELAIKAAVAATEGAETVNAALTGNVLTITDREGNTTSLDLSEIGGGYEPPVGGIPKTDLASDVQTSLGKADTALQSFTETDPTVPSWSKQSTKPSYSYSEITDKPTLATVATSGSYNDLSDKPTIPDAVSGTNDGTNWTSITIGSTTKAIPSGGAELPSNTAYLSNDSGEGIVPDDGIKAVTVTSAATMTISPDVVTVIDGEVGTAAITLQVPQDSLAHVWDIIFSTDTTVAVTLAMSNSAVILKPSGYALVASSNYEIRVVGKGTKFVLAYGKFV